MLARYRPTLSVEQATELFNRWWELPESQRLAIDWLVTAGCDLEDIAAGLHHRQIREASIEDHLKQGFASLAEHGWPEEKVRSYLIEAILLADVPDRDARVRERLKELREQYPNEPESWFTLGRLGRLPPYKIAVTGYDYHNGWIRVWRNLTFSIAIWPEQTEQIRPKSAV